MYTHVISYDYPWMLLYSCTLWAHWGLFSLDPGCTSLFATQQMLHTEYYGTDSVQTERPDHLEI